MRKLGQLLLIVDFLDASMKTPVSFFWVIGEARAPCLNKSDTGNSAQLNSVKAQRKQLVVK